MGVMICWWTVVSGSVVNEPSVAGARSSQTATSNRVHNLSPRPPGRQRNHTVYYTGTNRQSEQPVSDRTRGTPFQRRLRILPGGTAIEMFGFWVNGGWYDCGCSAWSAGGGEGVMRPVGYLVCCYGVELGIRKGILAGDW